MRELDLDINEFKERVRKVKTAALADASIVEQFARKVSENGGHVFFAKTGEDAIKYAVELAKRTGTRLIVKSKSLTSEEIEFNQGLERDGIRVLETDLGELICQLAREKPTHLVFPAVHKTAAQVAEIFSSEYGEKIPPEPEAILASVRRHLRPIFLSADMGVTGGNVGIAETGSVIMETNEGNGRLVSTLPRIHVVIIGMEKIVPTWDDAANVIVAHAMSATGQRMTVYVSCISQRTPLGGASDGREFHVIILDNGRSRMRDDDSFSDALNCIRCGACMNICPTYSIVGGHTFGYIYPGPIGIPWTANIHGLEKATFAHLCVSCGLCKEICPVDIDIPMMIAHVKEAEVRENGELLVDSFFAASESLAKVSSRTAPLSNWILRRYLVRYLMEKVIGVDRRRRLPSFSRRRLRDRLKGIDKSGGAAGNIVFFPDLYADYNDPDLGVKAVKLLQRLGFSVEIPDLKWSGMPYVSYGQLDKAKRVAEYNVSRLDRYVSDGYKILSTEPTAIYVLKEIYPKLLPSDASRKIAESSHGFFNYLQSHLGKVTLRASERLDGPVGFHIPCHDRALSAGRPAVEFLRSAGYDIEVIETGTCCGMAGTFGMKHGELGYDLSMAVGERLFQLFRESGCKMIATESSVCAMQLTDGVGVKVAHPLHMVEFE